MYGGTAVKGGRLTPENIFISPSEASQAHERFRKSFPGISRDPVDRKYRGDCIQRRADT